VKKLSEDVQFYYGLGKSELENLDFFDVNRNFYRKDGGVRSYIMKYEAIRTRYDKLRILHMKLVHKDRQKLQNLINATIELCKKEGLPWSACNDAVYAVKKIWRKSLPPSFKVRVALEYAKIINNIPGTPSIRMSTFWRLGLPIKRDADKTVAKAINNIVSELGLPPVVEYHAIKIYQIYKTGVSPSKSASTAAAVVYTAAKINNIDISQDAVSLIAGVTSQTLRYNLRKLGIAVDYYYYDGDSVKEFKWRYGRSYSGIPTPSNIVTIFNPLADLSKIDFTIELGRPIKVHIYTTKEKFRRVAEDSPV
jgi:hypothetical protein